MSLLLILIFYYDILFEFINIRVFGKYWKIIEVIEITNRRYLI